MNRVILIVLVVFTCSCAAVGKHTSLEIHNSLWQQKEHPHSNEVIFNYKCRESYSFEVKKTIGTENQIYAIGPIIPLIPIIVPIKNYGENIKFEIMIIGIIKPIREILENSTFYFSTNGADFVSVNKAVTVQTVEGFSHIDFNNAKISIDLPVNNKLPEYIRIHSNLDVNGCKIPDIEYKKKVENYAGFKIPHMGP